MTIELKGGLIVTMDAIRFAVDLEFRDHVLSVRNGQLLVSNASTLTAEDRVQIRRQRWHLMALATYEAP